MEILEFHGPGEHSGAIGFIGVSDPMGVKAIIEDTLMKYKKNL